MRLISSSMPVSVSALSDRGVRPTTGTVTPVTVPVSVSALSDRGVRRYTMANSALGQMRFSIRSFGSWGEAYWKQQRAPHHQIVSVSALSDRGVRRLSGNPSKICRSVSVSALSDRGVRQAGAGRGPHETHVSVSALSDRGVRQLQHRARRVTIVVSVSALSDRGVRPLGLDLAALVDSRFSIRSFGSWGEAPPPPVATARTPGFQYPLFRIVG